MTDIFTKRAGVYNILAFFSPKCTLRDKRTQSQFASIRSRQKETS